MSRDFSDERVWIRQTESASYGQSSSEGWADMGHKTSTTIADDLVRGLLHDAGLDHLRYGMTEWNPLGDLIRPGDKVVVKPNWVAHKNRLSSAGIECLVTHRSVIQAVLHYIVKTRPGQIIIADAPIQGCDFDALQRECRIESVLAHFRSMGHNIEVRDLRLTTLPSRFGRHKRIYPDAGRYCLFNLGDKSRLAPITHDHSEFRVTLYEPELMKQHHHPGRHEYLVAGDVIEADVVFNLPKLKTHKKAGMSGALKNAVGIVGFKEYLPHHRKGGSDSGGDCYEGRSFLKCMAENALDRANSSSNMILKYLNARLAGLVIRLNRRLRKEVQDLEGSWHGNDTVWRTCLDIQTILHYGDREGQLSDVPQRKVITITDAIVAGEGDGPLAPSPVPLRTMTFGTNVAALDWIHCLLMGLDPCKIPLVANAFKKDAWPLAWFQPDNIRVYVNGNILPDTRTVGRFGRSFCPSAGWRGHCEMLD